MVMAMVDRLLGREKWDPFEGKSAMPEPILVTMLPMPIQKAMTSPANRPTMAPCQRQHILSQCQPHQPPHQSPHSWPIPACSGSRWVTHRRVGTGKEHPKAEEPEQRPPDHAKDADGCLWRAELGTEHVGAETPASPTQPQSPSPPHRAGPTVQDSRRQEWERQSAQSSALKWILRSLRATRPRKDPGTFGYLNLFPAKGSPSKQNC